MAFLPIFERRLNDEQKYAKINSQTIKEISLINISSHGTDGAMR